MVKILLKLKDSFLTNLPWKIAAFLMAFVLWFLVMNVEDPMRNEIMRVQLELRNEDALATGTAEGIHLENIDFLRNLTISIQVRGTSRNLDAIRDTIGAYIDLSTSDIIAAAQRGEDLRVTIQPDRYGNAVELMSFSPRNVNLMMDTMTSVQMVVVLDEYGDISDDYFLLSESVAITPDVVTVTGPSSIVNRIDRLEVSANIDGATYTQYLEGVTITALDSAGDPVVSQHLQFQDTADIEIPIFRRGRVRVLEPRHEAHPPPGFGIHSVHWDPQWLDVAGEAEAIDALAPILLEPIPEGRIISATSNFSEEYDIRFVLPPDVFLIDPRINTIIVDVFIEPFVEREFTISIEDITIIGLPTGAVIITEEIAVNLAALQTVMAGVSNIAVTAIVNGEDLEVGYNEIPLVFALPARVSLLDSDEEPTITIYIETVEESEDEEEESEREEDEEAGD